MTDSLFNRLGRAADGLMIHGMNSSAVTDAKDEIVRLNMENGRLKDTIDRVQAIARTHSVIAFIDGPEQQRLTRENHARTMLARQILVAIMVPVEAKEEKNEQSD